ncbi:MAG: hypothetical protein F4144_11455 [Acidimicrobiaceae bacterium]|nr:hypothetical protein [Acidimicrobiaceae bacterium]
MALTVNRARLEHAKAKIVEKHPDFGESLLSLLERDGSQICFARWETDNRTVLRVRPSKQIADQFGITLEIPVLVATHENLQPRVLRQLEDHTELRKSPSADKDIAILIAASSRAQSYVRDRSRFSYPILVMLADKLAAKEYDDSTISSEVARLMRSINHFDHSGEIHYAADFFGRIGELKVLTDLVSTGESVGIFGLRRAGKTSLMYQVRNSLRETTNENQIESIYVQLNSITDADDFRESLVVATAQIAKRLGMHLPKKGTDMLNPDFSIRKIERTYRNEKSYREFIETEEAHRRWVTQRRWIYEINWLLDKIDRDVVIVLDEIDLANELSPDNDDESRVSSNQDLPRVPHQVSPTGSSVSVNPRSSMDARSDMNWVLQQLRGIIQIRGERGKRSLSILAAGVAATVFTRSERFSRDNQLYGFAKARFLGPMSHNEMTHMVRVLGKRSGLRLEDEALFDSLYEEYGGHPHLTRQACARVADQVDRQVAEVPYQVSLEDLQRVYESTAEGSPSDAVQQTFRSFARWYPSEARRVRHTITSGVAARPGEIPHAIDLGICHPDGRIRQRALLRWSPEYD